MILMPSNNTGKVVKELFQKYPDRLALLLNPQRFRPSYYKYRYAIDNGAFTTFNEKAFIRMIDGCPKSNPPIFVVVPDVVKCHDRTVALWNYYTPSLRRYGFKLAFAAQDGCTPETGNELTGENGYDTQTVCSACNEFEDRTGWCEYAGRTGCSDRSDQSGR